MQNADFGLKANPMKNSNLRVAPPRWLASGPGSDAVELVAKADLMTPDRNVESVHFVGSRHRLQAD